MTTVRVGAGSATAVTVPGRVTTAVTQSDQVTSVRTPGRMVTAQRIVTPPAPVDQTVTPDGGTVTYYQHTPQAAWSFTHLMGRTPKVTVYTLSGEEIEAEVQVTDTTVSVSFNMPMSGYIVIS